VASEPCAPALGTSWEQKPHPRSGISYLDHGTQLIVSQLAGCRMGQTIRDLHRLHGRDIGREFGDGCGGDGTDVYGDEALHQIWLGTEAGQMDASRDVPSGTGHGAPLPPRLPGGFKLLPASAESSTCPSPGPCVPPQGISREGQRRAWADGQNHRLLWVGRDLQRSPSPTPCSEQGHLQLIRLLRAPSSLAWKCFQGWGIHHLSGQPGPAFHHPDSKKFLPYIQSKSPLF